MALTHHVEHDMAPVYSLPSILAIVAAVAGLLAVGRWTESGCPHRVFWAG